MKSNKHFFEILFVLYFFMALCDEIFYMYAQCSFGVIGVC